METVTTKGDPPNRYLRLDTEGDVDQLIALIVDRKRTHPIVLVSTPNRSPDPLIDIERVTKALHRRAPVYLIPTGDLTWHLTHTGPVSIFGGPGFVIPPFGESGRPRTMRLRFAYNPEQGIEAADYLIEDALSITSADSYPTESRLPSGTVPKPRPKPSMVHPSPVPKVEYDPAIVSANAKIEELRNQIVEMKLTFAKEREGLMADNIDMRRKLSNAMQRKQLKRVSSSTPDHRPEPSVPIDAFTEPDRAVRHAIYQAWVTRIPPTEKADNPIGQYRLGPDFTDSLLHLDEKYQSKALRAVVDVVTDMAKSIPSRRLHHLRSGLPGSPPWTRTDDGAVCYRVNVETNTASARRLHFWKLADGSIELIRVVVHDEVTP